MPSLPIPASHPHRPEVHGHRGCRGLFPENTIPAFLHALQLGVDALELDVVISADNQVVVSHEPWLSARLGTGPAGEAIATQREHTYNLYRMPYATIRQCEVGAKHHPGFPQQQAVPGYRPLLREVLAATAAECQRLGRPLPGYSVELKSTALGDEIFHPVPAAFVALVLAALRSAGVLAHTTLLSFDQRILQAARVVADCPALCLLSEVPTPAEQLFAELGFVPEAFGPDFQLLSPGLVQRLATEFPGLRLVPWTVNKPADLAMALQWPLAGITTDYPNRLLSLLDNANNL